MRIHRILPLSRANGPGARFTVWVQGCSRHCQGCFNPLTHDTMAGFEMSIREIVESIPLEAAGVTISGGEPFEQPEELASLLEAVQETNLHTVVYTGFQFEELKASQNAAVQRSLALMNVLIDGEYKEGVQPVMPWTGSGNQRIIELNGDVFRTHNCHSMKDSVNDGEIIIDNTGRIVATGFLNSACFQEG